MPDHIVQAARDEYETTTGGSWENASFDDRLVYYTSAHRIIRSYLKGLSEEVAVESNESGLLHTPPEISERERRRSLGS